MYPYDGRIYNSFAAICQRDEELEDGVLQTMYYLMRSLACDTPHEAAREFLVDFFEELRIRFVQWRKTHEGSTGQNAKKGKKKVIVAVTDEDRLTGFLLAFFRVQGILYTKIAIDELDELFEQ